MSEYRVKALELIQRQQTLLTELEVLRAAVGERAASILDVLSIEALEEAVSLIEEALETLKEAVE